eukprot:g2949.t1
MYTILLLIRQLRAYEEDVLQEDGETNETVEINERDSLLWCINNNLQTPENGLRIDCSKYMIIRRFLEGNDPEKGSIPTFYAKGKGKTGLCVCVTNTVILVGFVDSSLEPCVEFGECTSLVEKTAQDLFENDC